MPNELAKETSPYLKQHADNPVNWVAWNPKAFAEAKRRDVPVLISIGYSTCHWCHVMSHESFEDGVTASQMNANYVCIKVDREEHPEVDAIYMDAIQALTGHGGWPLNAFAIQLFPNVFGKRSASSFVAHQMLGQLPGSVCNFWAVSVP